LELSGYFANITIAHLYSLKLLDVRLLLAGLSAEGSRGGRHRRARGTQICPWKCQLNDELSQVTAGYGISPAAVDFSSRQTAAAVDFFR